MKAYLTICLVALISINSFAQSKVVSIDLLELVKAQKLQVFNRVATPLSDGDKKGVSLSAKENDGVAWIDDVIFSNGVIELDIRGKMFHKKASLALLSTGLMKRH